MPKCPTNRNRRHLPYGARKKRTTYLTCDCCEGDELKNRKGRARQESKDIIEDELEEKYDQPHP